jgi:hypothetical protein
MRMRRTRRRRRRMANVLPHKSIHPLHPRILLSLVLSFDDFCPARDISVQLPGVGEMRLGGEELGKGTREVGRGCEVGRSEGGSGIDRGRRGKEEEEDVSKEFQEKEKKLMRMGRRKKKMEGGWNRAEEGSVSLEKKGGGG